jgi:hypothetical protein
METGSEERLLDRLWQRCGNNIKMNFTKIRREDNDWIQMI